MKTAIWQGGQLHTDFEEPFENLKRSNQLSRTKHEENAIATDQNEIWLPDMDSNHDSRLQRPLSYH